MKVFDQLTVVILASNEQESLRNTVFSVIGDCNRNDLAEIIVFLKSETCQAAIEFSRIQRDNKSDIPLRAYFQKRKTLPAALVEIPPLIHSSHFIIMFSDNANDPKSIPTMIEMERLHPDAIVCAAKWHPESDVNGYGLIRMAASRTINKIAAALVYSKGKDIFSIFQIYPVSLISELGISDADKFVYEYTLKPIAYGNPYMEIPTRFRAREEMISNYHLINCLAAASRFLYTAIKLHITAKRNKVL